MKPIEEEISKKIHEFDVFALINLLFSLGYKKEDILFKSNMINVSSPGLLDSIQFVSTPMKRVIVTVNLGLLSAITPLPSYFIKIIENAGLNEKAMVDFIEFFNHKVLQNYLYSIYPESDASLYPNWENTKRAYLRLCGMNRVTSLHHLFQMVFPELGLSVEPSRHKRSIKADGIILGKTKLEEGKVLGSYALVPLQGFDVILYCDEEYSNRRTTWADKIAKRLYEVIFPILQESQIHLRVILVIRSQKGWAQLKKGSYLGLDRIRGGIEKNRMVVIFHGQVTLQNPD